MARKGKKFIKIICRPQIEQKSTRNINLSYRWKEEAICYAGKSKCPTWVERSDFRSERLKAATAFLVNDADYAYGSYVDRRTDCRLDLGCPRYLLTVIKNSTRAERMSCAVAILLILICAVLITYFTVTSKAQNDIVDVAPHEWNITRKMWLAKDYNASESIRLQYEPLRLVVIQHTASSVCYEFAVCAAELRNIQHAFIKDCDYDIPYNFIIGNDGRVYEGRGWRIEGAHTRGFNRCSLGIGFIGDYREEFPGHTEVTKAQLNRTQMLLDEGVNKGYLHPSYLVVGAKDLMPSESPGSNLHSAIKKWTHYDHEHRYKGKNCDQITASPITIIEKA